MSHFRTNHRVEVAKKNTGNLYFSFKYSTCSVEMLAGMTGITLCEENS